MYSTTSFRLTKEQYNYLLPICRNKILYSKDLYSFIGSKEEFTDILTRCKYLDEDLINESLEYKERLESNRIYNSGASRNFIHH